MCSNQVIYFGSSSWYANTVLLGDKNATLTLSAYTCYLLRHFKGPSAIASLSGKESRFMTGQFRKRKTSMDLDADCLTTEQFGARPLTSKDASTSLQTPVLLPSQLDGRIHSPAPNLGPEFTTLRLSRYGEAAKWREGRLFEEPHVVRSAAIADDEHEKGERAENGSQEEAKIPKEPRWPLQAPMWDVERKRSSEDTTSSSKRESSPATHARFSCSTRRSSRTTLKVRHTISKSIAGKRRSYGTVAGPHSPFVCQPRRLRAPLSTMNDDAMRGSPSHAELYMLYICCCLAPSSSSASLYFWGEKGALLERKTTVARDAGCVTPEQFEGRPPASEDASTSLRTPAFLPSELTGHIDYTVKNKTNARTSGCSLKKNL